MPEIRGRFIDGLPLCSCASIIDRRVNGFATFVRNAPLQLNAIPDLFRPHFMSYQSDVYSNIGSAYYPSRGLAVLGEGCRSVLR